jgi:hypothetical protein
MRTASSGKKAWEQGMDAATDASSPELDYLKERVAEMETQLKSVLLQQRE